MRLLELKLQDFQGLRRFELTADGRNVGVYGTNGTGKTTVANALSWILFDKPYTGEKNYSPKTTDEDGNDLHHLDHRAEAVFEKDDGSRITLAKVFHEVWKKKRGSASEEFSGHVTDAFIDGVPVSTSEYRRTLESICPPEQAKILTDPRYFAKTMHWDDRRAVLLEMCGDVSDAEVIASDPELTPLWEYLRKPGTADQYYSVAEFLKIAGSRKAELNRELTILPARIDETVKAIPDTDELPAEDTIEAKLAELEGDKMALMGQAAAMTTDEQTQILRRQLAEIELKIVQGRTGYQSAIEFKNRAANEAIQDMAKAVAGADAEILIKTQEISRITSEISAMQNAREELLRHHGEVKSRVWTGDTTCGACGQELPLDMVEAAKSRFNQQRSRELAEINEKGQKCSKTMIEGKQAELDTARAALDAAMAEKTRLTEELDAARGAVPVEPPYEETAEYTALAAQRSHIASQVGEESTTMADRKAALQAQIDAITAEIRKTQDAKLIYVTARKRRERLAELETQEKEIAREYERFDRGVYLCEAFTRAKVNMLDERINSRFRAVRFRLFKQQINGGLQDCCDVLCPTSCGLTPYDSANNAAQIQAGAEIASALSKHWGVSLPLIVDNAESVVGEIPTRNQIIRLVVSEQDKRLRVVFEGDGTNDRGAA